MDKQTIDIINILEGPWLDKKIKFNSVGKNPDDCKYEVIIDDSKLEVNGESEIRQLFKELYQFEKTPDKSELYKKMTNLAELYIQSPPKSERQVMLSSMFPNVERFTDNLLKARLEIDSTSQILDDFDMSDTSYPRVSMYLQKIIDDKEKQKNEPKDKTPQDQSQEPSQINDSKSSPQDQSQEKNPDKTDTQSKSDYHSASPMGISGMGTSGASVQSQMNHLQAKTAAISKAQDDALKDLRKSINELKTIPSIQSIKERFADVKSLIENADTIKFDDKQDQARFESLVSSITQRQQEYEQHDAEVRRIAGLTKNPTQEEEQKLPQDINVEVQSNKELGQQEKESDTETKPNANAEMMSYIQDIKRNHKQLDVKNRQYWTNDSTKPKTNEEKFAHFKADMEKYGSQADKGASEWNQGHLDLIDDSKLVDLINEYDAKLDSLNAEDRKRVESYKFEPNSGGFITTFKTDSKEFKEAIRIVDRINQSLAHRRAYEFEVPEQLKGRLNEEQRNYEETQERYVINKSNAEITKYATELESKIQYLKPEHAQLLMGFIQKAETGSINSQEHLIQELSAIKEKMGEGNSMALDSACQYAELLACSFIDKSESKETAPKGQTKQARTVSGDISMLKSADVQFEMTDDLRNGLTHAKDLRLKVDGGTSIEDVMNKIGACKKNGLECRAMFNGIELNSRDFKNKQQAMQLYEQQLQALKNKNEQEKKP